MGLTGKLYYSIKEVADNYQISESTLRNWEREFANLKPKRSGSGDRKYTDKDLKTIEKIIELRKDLTLSGAKKALKGKATKVDDTTEIINNLQDIRQFLVAIKESL